MLPSWESLQQTWPLLVLVAGVWARIEVALKSTQAQSKRNEVEITKLEVKVEAQAAGQQQQAVQLGRIEATVNGISGAIDRLERKIPGG
jgi:DNA transposition AAA+ family ATPase